MSADSYGKAPRRRQTGTRPQPYDPAKDRTHANSNPNDIQVEEEGMFETPANAYKVGSTTDVRELASTITQACVANHEIPALLTIGPASINQAVKGIAAAAAELSGDGGQLTFQPAFRHTNRTKPLIAFYLTRQHFPLRPDTGEVVELTATANQKIIALAGAIAGKVRELKRTHLMALGADAVTNAVLAIGNARLFLENDTMDIKVQPEFVKIIKNGTQMSALKFNIIPERIA